MKNRRYFLVQSTLATTAMFALKPLTSFGRSISQSAGFNGSYGKLAFLHTANLSNNSYNKVIRYIKDIKNKNPNAVLLNAGQGIQDGHGSLIYDASINGSNDLFAINGEYKIIKKGNVRIGIISARPAEKNIVQKIKTLSTWLKKEKNCTVVVCLSQLGYKNNNTPDDITLAKKSTHLDIIVGGHAENFHMHPVVALNSDNAEVIIHSASGNSFECGNIEIDFDEQGRKNQISFANHSSKNITADRAISAG
jgi:2',3'-cyclic-nucleotide 2'-phosphodiesterase (5'-nucleotidase family)